MRPSDVKSRKSRKHLGKITSRASQLEGESGNRVLRNLRDIKYSKADLLVKYFYFVAFFKIS